MIYYDIHRMNDGNTGGNFDRLDNDAPKGAIHQRPNTFLLPLDASSCNVLPLYPLRYSGHHLPSQTNPKK